MVKYLSFFWKCFTEFRKLNDKNYQQLKGLFEPVICCVRDQDVNTKPANYSYQSQYSNSSFTAFSVFLNLIKKYWIFIPFGIYKLHWSDTVVACQVGQNTFQYTGWARLIRSHSSARFYFELSGYSNYFLHCNSNYVQNFELEINSI